MVGHMKESNMFQLATRIAHASIVALGLSLAACGTGDAALEDETAVTEAAVQSADGGRCLPFNAIARPIAVQHLHDPSLQQTIGRTFWHVRGMRALRGTALATILGPAPDGSLRANHHFAFEDGTLRTQNDVVRIRPTSDPCVFDAETEVFVADGTGQFAGLRGQARGEGQVSFCGDEGRIELRGQLCPAAGSSR
jgi:hypothetical protein